VNVVCADCMPWILTRRVAICISSFKRNRAKRLPSRAAAQKTLLSFVTCRPHVLEFRFFIDLSAAPRLRRSMLMRDRVVLTTSLILVFRRPFLHSGIFTFWIIVLHGALFRDLSGSD